MPAPADAHAPRTALLTIQAGGSNWAIPSSAVGSIQPFDAATPGTALDLLALLGARAAPLFETWRVVVLHVSGEQLPLLVRGSLHLLEMPTQSLVPLPPPLTSSSPFVTHVALVDGKPSLLVVSPERLLGAFPTDAGPRSPLLTTSSEASSC